MNTYPHPIPGRLARRNPGMSLVLLALAVGAGGDAIAAEISPTRTESLVITEDDDTDPPSTDLDSGGPDSSDPDPGREDERPDDICIEREPLDPADDFWWEEPFERPDGPGDLETDADHAEIWLTASDPHHLMAYITGDRVWHWDANPAAPIWSFRVDPERPIEANASLDVHLRTQPGFDYDVYFWFEAGAEMHGARMAIDNLATGQHHEMAPVGSAWTSVSGPPAGSDPVNHLISLSLAGWPDEEARWSVTAVQIVATPE